MSPGRVCLLVVFESHPRRQVTSSLHVRPLSVFFQGLAHSVCPRAERAWLSSKCKGRGLTMRSSTSRSTECWGRASCLVLRGFVLAKFFYLFLQFRVVVVKQKKKSIAAFPIPDPTLQHSLRPRWSASGHQAHCKLSSTYSLLSLRTPSLRNVSERDTDN